MKLTMQVWRGRGRVGFSIAGLGVLGLLALALLLPAWLRPPPMTAGEAERLIGDYLVAQVALANMERGDAGTRRAHDAIARAQAVTFESVDVRTSVFSAFRVTQSYIVRAVPVDRESGLPEYYCFPGGVLTGACGRWNWVLAW
jgi:hypothetical protein